MKRLFCRIAFASMLLGPFSLSTIGQRQSDSRSAAEIALATDVRVGWLKNNVVSVRTVDPKDQDFSDLMPLKKSIGNARIVMLGESSHGDGGTALGKTRLVEFLHQKMGFDVLVFEGGLYDMTKVWGSLQKGDATVPALRQGVMPAWSGSDQSQKVFDYLVAHANTRHPMEIAGFDSQRTGTATRQYLLQDLGAFLKDTGIKTDLVVEGSASRSILEDVITGKYWSGTPVPSPAQQAAYLGTYDLLEKDILANRAGANNLRKGFWIQALQNLRTSSKQIWLSQLKDPAVESATSRARDRQGAENLLWLANERYRGRKIIVWAATFHVFRNKGFGPGQCTPKDADYCSQIPMGQHVWERIGRDVYTIGFSAYGGNKGFMVAGKPAEEWTGPLKQDQHASIEMEELLNATGFDYAFVDFKTPRKGGDWLRTPIWSRLLGNSTMVRNWTETMDAMFFLREQQFDTRKAW